MSKIKSRFTVAIFMPDGATKTDVCRYIDDVLRNAFKVRRVDTKTHPVAVAPESLTVMVARNDDLPTYKHDKIPNRIR